MSSKSLAYLSKFHIINQRYICNGHMMNLVVGCLHKSSKRILPEGRKRMQINNSNHKAKVKFHGKKLKCESIVHHSHPVDLFSWMNEETWNAQGSRCGEKSIMLQKKNPGIIISIEISTGAYSWISRKWNYSRPEDLLYYFVSNDFSGCAFRCQEKVQLNCISLIRNVFIKLCPFTEKSIKRRRKVEQAM